MRFEEFASRAGRAAADIGRQSKPPSFPSILEAHRRRTLIVGWSTAVAAFAIVVLGAVMAWPGGSGAELTPVAATTTPSEGEESCSVTLPSDSAFNPASEAPDGQPPSSETVWYGTPELWTSIHPEGEVWAELPAAEDGSLTQKTFWWSRDFVSITDPNPDIEFTAEQLDGSQATAASAVTFGGNPEQGVFLVVLFQIPEEGCWRITSEYRTATLSYVVWVGDAAARLRMTP